MASGKRKSGSFMQGKRSRDKKQRIMSLPEPDVSVSAHPIMTLSSEDKRRVKQAIGQLLTRPAPRVFEPLRLTARGATLFEALKDYKLRAYLNQYLYDATDGRVRLRNATSREFRHYSSHIVRRNQLAVLWAIESDRFSQTAYFGIYENLAIDVLNEPPTFDWAS